MRRATLLSSFAFVGLSLALLGQVRARAELVFEQKTIERPMGVTESELRVTFPFRNEGTQTVKIREVGAGCTCTIPTVKKVTYAPGETGEIEVKFVPAFRHGVQREGVVVKTDDPAQPFVSLTLIATIPKVISMSKPVLLWENGEAMDPKSIKVTVPSGAGIRDLRALARSPRLRVAVQRVTDSTFEVKVTPSPYARNLTEPVQIEAVIEGAQVKHSNLYVRVP